MSINSKFSLKVNPITACATRYAGRLATKKTKNFIFVSNTGRCGSQTLQQYFSTVPGAISLHEPAPPLNKEILVRYNNGDDKFLHEQFMLRKIPRIYLAAKFKKYYVETSNVFIKVYANETANYFKDRLKVIHLFRDRDSVAQSYYERHEAKNENTIVPSKWDWLIQPWAPRNILYMEKAEFSDGRFAHPYFIHLWQCYEVEARTIQFGKNYPDVQIVRIRTEQLNDIDAIQNLFEQLGMPTSKMLGEVLGKSFNASFKPPVWPRDLASSKIIEFHEICQERMRSLGLEPVCGGVPDLI